MFFSILTLLVVKNLAKNMGEELGVQLDSASANGDTLSLSTDHL
jgi:hypothetical protein